MSKFLPTVSVLGAVFLAAAASPSAAQANKIPGTDVELGFLDVGLDVRTWGRIGASFPNGTNGFSITTTSCNRGTVNVPWLQAMNENHPLIAFMFAREVNGRLEQISDRSHVKHGFFALSSSQCTPCQNPSPGTFLGVGCSDTYDTNNNGDRFWLGPADEINPWLGTWDATCSFFDTPTGGTCDSNRSYFGSEPNPVNHRITVDDADLNDSTATYYYYGYYVIRGEPEGVRTNNSKSRIFVPGWTGSSWSIATAGIPNNNHVEGSILKRWNGATITSVMNGGDDGRVFVGTKVTDLGGGNWHYEYAIHNRDNVRGVSSFKLPKTRNAVISNVGFSDIDGNASNDWTVTTTPCEIAWETTSNPCDWNTVYNFWFDATVGPDSGHGVKLGQFDPGAGLDEMLAPVMAPADPNPLAYCSGKLNSLGCVPSIDANGSPSVTPGGSSYMITGTDIVPVSGGLLVYSTSGRASLPFNGGILCIKAPQVRLLPVKSSGTGGQLPCAGSFQLNFNNRIQSGSDPFLTPGTCVTAQWIYRDPNLMDGTTTGLSNAIEFLITP